MFSPPGAISAWSEHCLLGCLGGKVVKVCVETDDCINSTARIRRIRCNFKIENPNEMCYTTDPRIGMKADKKMLVWM